MDLGKKRFQCVFRDMAIEWGSVEVCGGRHFFSLALRVSRVSIWLPPHSEVRKTGSASRPISAIDSDRIAADETSVIFLIYNNPA